MTIGEARAGKLWRPPRRWITGSLVALLAILLAFSFRPIMGNHLISLGCEALKRGEPELAARHFLSAQRVEPHRAEIAFWLARCNRKLKDPERVKHYLEEARKLSFSDDGRLRREWWLLLAENGRLKDAEPHLKQMLCDEGQDGQEICDAFSKGYCLNLRFKEARALLDAWEQAFPNDYRPILRRGQILAGEEKWVLAAEQLRVATLRSPDQALVRRELARCLFKSEDRDGAKRELSTLLESDPFDSAALLIMAQICHDERDLTGGIALLERLISRYPHDFDAGLLRAKLTLESGDAVAAVSQAKALEALWPEDVETQFLLASSLRLTGHPDEAVQHFTRHHALQTTAARIEKLAKEVNSHPSDPERRFELGQLLLRHSSRKEGAAWLQSVFQFDPTHQGAHQLLSEYFQKIGEADLSRQHQHRIKGEQTEFPMMTNVSISAGGPSK